MIRVRDLEPPRRFYHDAFDLEISHCVDFLDFPLVYLRNGETDTELEFTWNREHEQPYARGDGYGHVSFSVDAVNTTHRGLSELELALKDMREFRASQGELIARYFFVEDLIRLQDRGSRTPRPLPVRDEQSNPREEKAE